LTETLQLERTDILVHVHDAPKLLVEWSPRWEEFVTSIRPAFARSESRLAGEAPHGVSSYRSTAAALLLEAFLLFVVMVLPRQIAHMRPYAAPKLVPYEVIYYSGDELPRTQDVGGAQAGTTGRAGGRQAHHHTQTIRVARGASLAAKVVDAPNLKLPSSSAAVANLLAMKAAPGAPSAEGLRSSLVAPRLSENVVAPAANNISREQARDSPTLNAAIVPPAPSVQSEHRLVAPVLNSSVIAPAPNVSRDRTLTAPALNSNVVAPAPSRVLRDRGRSTPDLQGSVIPPAPTSASREVSPSRVQMNSAAVVPPPVSAPERESDRTAKLSMPAPSVIAPPPSADSTRELRRLESGGTTGTAQSIVPPPPTATNNTSLVSSIIGKLFGTQDVVPPPPNVSAGGASGTSRNPNGTAGGLASNVIPPPPSAAGSASGSSGTSRRSAPGDAPVTSVIPPPPSVSGAGGAGGSGTGNANALANNVVPPPPGLGGGSTPFGSGSGRKGAGLGGPGDAGSVLAPPKGGNGNSDTSGVVLSSQPGSAVGIPGNGGKGSLAISPSGGDKPGLGGLGDGSGIGSGNGPGSGLTGEGSGAGKTGAGHGSDPNARGGISPTPGPGGAGNASGGSPSVPGVDVRGGSTVVNLPSFGSGGGGTNDPSLPGRSSVQGDKGPAITIVATSRSGGAFDFYGKLPGDNYSVYVDTPAGTAVMQFAEVNPGRTGPLMGPQGLRTELPKGLPHNRVVVKCKVDASGNLKNLQVLEPGPAAMTAKIVAALLGWKFRPATRGGQPIEINAILGFNINTNDRN
jgi:TonB family protein